MAEGPPFCPEFARIIVSEVEESSHVQNGGRLKPRWTLNRLIQWIQEISGIKCCRETVRKVLKRGDLSWKKAKKLLEKADTKKREAYLEKIQQFLEEAMNDRCLLVFVDEAHIRMDVDPKYGWSRRGEDLFIPSNSPGFGKVSFYGVYLYNEGQVRILPYERANSGNTIDMLRRLREELPNKKIKLVWDNAKYHYSQIVQETIAELEIELIGFPAYSPDLMPVEPLWKWLREEVTSGYCHNSADELIGSVSHFEQSINRDPYEIADRLWVKTELNPEEEKLRVSK